MNNLKSTSDLVRRILEKDEQARNSDSHLYMRVIEIVADEWPVSLYGMTVCYFLENMKRLGAPPFESVRRARQKMQAKYPHLAACEKVAEARMENEREYRAFAKEE